MLCTKGLSSPVTCLGSQNPGAATQRPSSIPTVPQFLGTPKPFSVHHPEQEEQEPEVTQRQLDR